MKLLRRLINGFRRVDEAINAHHQRQTEGLVDRIVDDILTYRNKRYGSGTIISEKVGNVLIQTNSFLNVYNIHLYNIRDCEKTGHITINMVGGVSPFWVIKNVYSDPVKHNFNPVSAITPENVIKAINVVSPGLIKEK